MTRSLSLLSTLVLLSACSPEGPDSGNSSDSLGSGAADAGAGSTGGSSSSSGGAASGGAASGGAASGGSTATGGGSASGGADPGSGGSTTVDPNDPTVACVETTGAAIQDLGDGTLFDPNTCLMWMKTPFKDTESGLSGEVTGVDHVASCSMRNEGGRNDWRGPDIAEMRSMTTGCGGWNDASYLRPELSPTNPLSSEHLYWTAGEGNDATHPCLLIGATGKFTGGRRKQGDAVVSCVRGSSSITGSETVCSDVCP